MATNVAAVVFEMLEVIDVQPGVWCPTCALPAACRVLLASRIRGDEMRLSSGIRCPDCGWGIPARL